MAIKMVVWLRCKISPGLFSDEYAVAGELFDGSGFSLFADADDVDFEEEPKEEAPVDGTIRVTLIKREGDLLLVLLPQPTLESGQAITVKSDTVSQKQPRQEA